MALNFEVLQVNHFRYLVVERVDSVVDECKGLELDEIREPIRQLVDLAILELQYL